ncbi:hypothetical protein JOD64_005248 [Micromonospora luteifusca]|uniref:NB-ARC domain-containing protein n=1 Tax=Micromonospora luteifusca TaxID=709860 RepID=A0ABS2M0S3_9ACTN|nr:NB-ARC domain-containing protein [Micromonospora luteifusca]MBM7494026.1 hypothetical protein [Micromonospora luteifusca]
MTSSVQPVPVASGTRAAAIGSNSGSVLTGDNNRIVQVSPGAVRTPDQVPAPTRLVFLPRVPVDPFVGREAALDGLAGELERGAGVVAQVLHGLGGVGKSELALQYADRYADRYQLVWWVQAEDGERLDASLAELARRLEPAHGLLGITTSDAAGWAIQWLQCHSGWLLIFDNVEERATVAAVMGKVGRYGKIVITTRRNINWRGTARPLQIAVLSADAAVALLTELTSHTGHLTELEALCELAGELGYLPLALEQAGAFIAQEHRSVREYLRLWREKPAEAFEGVDEGGDAARTIARIWDMTLDAINQRDR